MEGAGILITVLLVVIAIAALVFISKAARIVNQYEKGIVMRFGKYHGLTD